MLAVFPPAAWAQSPHMHVFSHTTIQSGLVIGECGTAMDAVTAANYLGVDTFCGLFLFDNATATSLWRCDGTPSAQCSDPNPSSAIPGVTYSTNTGHGVFPQFINGQGFFDPFHYGRPAGVTLPQVTNSGDVFALNDGIVIWPSIAGGGNILGVAQSHETHFVTTSVSPSQVTVFAGQSVSFTANRNVRWTLHGDGAITASTATTATYKAPASIATAHQAFLEACNPDTSHGNDCPEATINLKPITVTIEEDNTTTEVIPGLSHEFHAHVAPDNLSQDVTWSILDDPDDAGEMVGSLFIAHTVTVPHTLKIQACSTLDATRCDVALVDVPLVTITVRTTAPNPLLGTVGAQAQFFATVNGTGNNGVNWSVSPGAPGTIDGNGLFTVTQVFNPPTGISVKACLQATAALPPEKQICNNPSAGLSLAPPVVFTVSPATLRSGEITSVTIIGTGLGSAPTVSFDDPRITFQQTSISLTLQNTTIQGNVSVPALFVGEATNLNVTQGFSPPPITPPARGSKPFDDHPGDAVGDDRPQRRHAR
jgi:hypothetical protein